MTRTRANSDRESGIHVRRQYTRRDDWLVGMGFEAGGLAAVLRI